MTLRRAFFLRTDRRAALLLSASVATLACGLTATSASAQTAAGSLAARINSPRPQVQAPSSAPVRTVTARAALARQKVNRTRTDQIRSYILSARDAATAANRPPVSDGLSAGGLDPTDAIREAVAAANAGDTNRANQLLISASAAQDSTGLKTWEGAGLPSQTIVDGRVQVTINQTQERALLSWNSFNIGQNTTLQFNQKANGVAQPGWVAVNRVTDSVAPSQILGNLKADGTVVVLNQRGIIFGQKSQVNTHSLLASTLELGNAAQFASGSSGVLRGATIRERNAAYLQNGLFAPPNGSTGSGGSGSDNVALLVSANLDASKPASTSPGFTADIEGDVVVDRGAQISSGSGGFLILAAPTIDSAGLLNAADGQVSLQAGRAVSFEQATGAADSADPFIRGYRFNSFAYDSSSDPLVDRPQTASDGTIRVSGLIESKRGYLSLGTGAFGSVELTGLLSTTTSVSRNGKISILSGNVSQAGSADPARASGIEMLADNNGETIPIGTANDPADFKASQLEIARQVQMVNAPFGGFAPTNFSMGENAVILAPGANVSIGRTTVNDFAVTSSGRVEIASGALIDVSGLKDVQLDASRNQIEITPVKRNELRDTPNYREIAIGDDFSLNGQTLVVDPRLHGVRDDGVAWIGSPLIEAGSIAGQIPATVQEFMTKGGSVSLLGQTVATSRSATIDFSGGWVNYAAGPVRTSRLLTNDGRIVDIGRADPNDVYVGVAQGFTEIQPRFGLVRSYLNAPAQGQRNDPSYDEGRDAGALNITGASVTMDGTLYGNAFAGSRQIAGAERPSVKSALDSRMLQRTQYELPSGGGLVVRSLGDVLVYHGVRGSAEANPAELLLNDDMLNDAGLSLIDLAAAGAVTFAGAAPTTLQSQDALTITGASNLALVPGGQLSVLAGRTIRFDGSVEAPSGTISARTVGGFAPTTEKFPISLTGGAGSLFRDDDDITLLNAADPTILNPFDIVVNGALTTAGLWVNDFTEGGIRQGGAFSDGGSINLRVAPSVFVAVGESLDTATKAVDLSGSIRINGHLNVSSGGYVTPTGSLVLSGRGGDVTLRNDTVYASRQLTNSGRLGASDGAQLADLPLNGSNQTVEFTPIPGTGIGISDVVPSLVADPRSTVQIAPGSIQGFGFGGGGTFTLVAPDVSFGSDNRAGSTHIGFDFFRTTGFGTLDISSYRSRIVDDLFANDRVSKSAFLETSRFVVGSGETLDLTQWILPSILDADQARALRGLATGADLLAQPLFAPIRPSSLWDQRGAHLVLGGLTELDVLAGGRIIGAPEASITFAKLYNAGDILLRGGTLSQRNDLVDNLIVGGLGVRDTDLGGRGLEDAFGGPLDGAGRFLEGALNSAGVVDPADGNRVLTNSELVSRDGADRLIYFLGLLDQSQGVVLDAGSTTDLSGIALFDPRAVRAGNGAQIRVGRVLDGGTLETAAGRNVLRRVTQSGSDITVSTGRTLIRDDAALLDISGTSATYDQVGGLGRYVPYLEWSAGGTISALGGGVLGNTPVLAHGGASQAEGGTLEWLRPTVGSGPAGDLDYLNADFIADSGFDTLAARGSLTLDGTFSLSLRKALMVTSQDPTGATNDADGRVTIGATSDAKASLFANYIRFASRIEVTNPLQSQAEGAAVDFVAGAQGFDFVGGIGFDSSIASLALITPGDVRLSGVRAIITNGQALGISGQLIAAGDLLIDAGRTYATTGTGNYQVLLEGLPPAQAPAYDLAVLGDHSITFGNTFLDRNVATPLTAGTHLRILARHISQNGYLAAPLGYLEVGSATDVNLLGGIGNVAATETVTFGAGSVTTVSGEGLNIPYGTTTDLIEYFFPTFLTPISKLPVGQLRVGAESIDQNEGALINGRGGGDTFAYEFQSGVGGSRDVLDRTNRDAFSSNLYDPATGQGYQYPDARQVFALVPVAQASKMALYDPIYSADYGSAGPVDLYGAGAGRTVRLDAAPGIAAGEYLLLPAKYAMSIPGALRIVENTSVGAPVPGTSATLLDGSIIVGGTYSYAGTGIAESTRHSFTIQSKDVFTKYSTIRTTSGSQSIIDQAAKDGVARPRLPLDAARVILSPLNELRVAGIFDTTPAAGGQGGQFDITGNNIAVVAEGAAPVAGALTLVDTALNNLHATSLLVGGERAERADGGTALNFTASSIHVGEGATLQAAELLLGVVGAGSELVLADGATLKATGELGVQPVGDYTVAAGGSLIRLANGAERLIARTGLTSSTIEVGNANLSGKALALDSSGNFAISDGAQFAVSQIALSGQSVRFSDENTNEAGVISSALEAKLGAAERLTIRSPGAIRFSSGTHRFNDLVLDTATISAFGNEPDGAVSIRARDVRVTNSTNAADGCVVAGFCGEAGSFTLDSRTLTFGTNDVRAIGFADAVDLGATDGMYVEGKGSFSVGDAGLVLRTPFLADRAAAADPRDQKVRPDYSILTKGSFLMTSAGTNAAAEIQGNRAPGARIGIGTIDSRVGSARIEGSTIRATAGIIDVQSTTDIALTGATLSTPGYNVVFGDSSDPVTISARGGTINLLAAKGNIATDAATRFITDTGVDAAGTLNLLASNGSITLDALINPDAKGARDGSFAFDSGTGAFDLGGFAARNARLFGGDIWVRSGAGNLDLAAGLTIKARNVTLTADGGSIAIGGTIDTSGVNVAGMSADEARNAAVNGGDIGLWGAAGVTLLSTARLDTHTTGYADTDTRAASAGDVSIGIERENAAIVIQDGAIIDVGARRTQAAQAIGESGGRLIPKIVTDPSNGSPVTVYDYAAPDSGGDVAFRAPVLGAGENKVNVSLHGSIQGADNVQLEVFKRYDLDAIAQSGLYSGISVGNDGTLLLNFADTSASGGRYNPFTEDFTLADGSSSLVRYIQNFDVSTVDGSSLDGIRLRPGVELGAQGAIKTESQWNLAAASFSPAQLQAAVDAGVLEVIPQLSGNGQTQYRVVAGQEGALLDRFATFLYRVGGKARGEAPVVTLRAGGDLTINRSISDGFFTFHDKSDPAWISYQLGGGDRSYSPTFQFNCGTTAGGNCNNVIDYAAAGGSAPPSSQSISISLTSGVGLSLGGGSATGSPLALKGNGAAANGELGDSLGFGELFPLLSDDTAIHSSDLRLVAGAGDTLSVNPLAVNRALDADVRVSGEYSYDVSAAPGTVTRDGALMFSYAPGVSFGLEDALGLTDPTGGLNSLNANSYTTLSWGSGTSGLSADARAAAQAYFAGKGFRFVGPAGRPTGIAAPLSEVVAFLQSFEAAYHQGLAAGRPGYTTSTPPSAISYGSGEAAKAYVRSYVRTGDGSIDVAAARDIDLRGTPDLVYRTEAGVTRAVPNYGDGEQAAQVGGSAIYTAGVRVAPTSRDARIVGSGVKVTVTPDSPYLLPKAENVSFIPSPKAYSDAAPVLADGGGDVSLVAGRDVLGRSDIWSEFFLDTARAATDGQLSTRDASSVGGWSQLWRLGGVSLDTEIGIAPRYFTSGVGALAGGDVAVDAGRDVQDLSIAVDTGVTTTTTDAGAAMLTLGGGNLSVHAGRDIAAGRYDIAAGAATIRADRDITRFGMEPMTDPTPRYLRVRLTDAVVDTSAGGAATVASVSSLGVDPGSVVDAPGQLGFYSAGSLFRLAANEGARLAQGATPNPGFASQSRDFGQARDFIDADRFTQILPSSVEMISLTGSIGFNPDAPQLLFPSPIGQLRLFSAGSIDHLAIGMSDADPSLLGGAFVDRLSAQVPFALPYINSTMTDAQLRLQHNQRTTHLGDPDPIRIYSNGDITTTALFLPKQARITAGGDIIDMYFVGQNLSAEDVTRVRAGGDISGSIGQFTLPYVVSNNFILGGPGTLIVEAGRDLGPFVSSSNIVNPIDGSIISNAGGIRTVGNDYNPWLDRAGADLSVRFGMANGADYSGLRDTYLDPENFAKLDGDLFEQVEDGFGNSRPDRSKPIYAPLLAEWLREHAPAAFATIFGAGGYPDTDAGNAALANAAYGKMADLYSAFAKIDPLRQQDFLVNTLYFNELAQPGNPKGPSYQQYVRGYRAVEALFPASAGYTDNLAPYTVDPSSVSEDHPLGEPVRNIVNGQPQVASRVDTGNVDLRLATIQTGRGGDVTILGPGGDVLAGSVVRTSEQAQRRNTAFTNAGANQLQPLESGNFKDRRAQAIASVPIGYEGILTLEGGQIRTFTDGDFILNQSRLFSQAGGDITMWSSNGDLNAGQGPKSASNFPPVTIRLDENGAADVNSAGSVSGAGIGTFRRTPLDPPSTVTLIAPVGEVDFGDAGVRASGNVIVAAARVANADNVQAAGDIVGVPVTSITASAVTPADAASAVAAQAAAATKSDAGQGNRRSLITVDVLGPARGANCPDPQQDDQNCKQN